MPFTKSREPTHRRLILKFGFIHGALTAATNTRDRQLDIANVQPRMEHANNAATGIHDRRET